MTRKRRKQGNRKMQFDMQVPSIEQIRNGDFERNFVTHTDTNTKAMTYRRRDSAIVEKWIADEEEAVKAGRMPSDARLFPVQAQRVIADCVLLWAKIGCKRITARYDERVGSGSQDSSERAQEALDVIFDMKRMLGPYQRHQWPVFENVLRHNLPAGVAGSHFGNNPTQRIHSAKLIVSNVACFLAGKLGY